MNIAKMMKQAQQMQEKMQTMQSDLALKEVEATVGGDSGKITVRANGAGEVLGIKIDPAIVEQESIEILEDLVLSGVRKAIDEGKALAAEEMKAVTGGMDLPPGLGF